MTKVPEGFAVVRKSDLIEVRDTLMYWIDREDRRGMTETEFRSWRALGYGSKAMTALRAMIADAAPTPDAAPVVTDAMVETVGSALYKYWNDVNEDCRGKYRERVRAALEAALKGT